MHKKITVLELVGPSKRGLANAVPNLSWAVGLSILPLIAYLSRYWVTLGFTCTSIAVLMFGYWKFLPESPRWLVSHEKYEEAADSLMMIAKTNGKKVDRQDILMKIKVRFCHKKSFKDYKKCFPYTRNDLILTASFNE
ncbi:hypothetical protein AVEN_98483-1 [Araneus ventricosus]|uniref:Carcinine transporter n=1 Tax=Araneus ventricosus TaxID=182803 RepID=A0A4Y2QYU3_ARAVE|nr:hypothetical protein AVEN_98483-1 [Araneus ventricosus]